MTKANIPQYSATAASNTDVQDIDIAENCAPSGINNAIREIMADLKDQDTGAVAMTSPVATSLTVTNEITANGGIALGDNDKATFGDSDDLQIYHDGSSRIANSTGNLIISDTDGDIYIQAKAGENSIRANNDGSVLVYFDNAEKLSTTSTGIAVTGTIDSSDISNFSVTYNNFSGDGLHIQSTGTSGDGAYAGGISFSRISSDNDSRAAGIAAVQTDTDIDKVGLAFFTHPDATTSNDLSEAMRIDASGNVGIGEDAPNSKLRVKDDDTTVATLESTGDNSFISFVDTGTNSRTHVQIGSEDNAMVFHTGGSESMQIDASGHAIIPTGVTLGTAVGVYSADNTLSDYEEGTWVPTYVGSTAAGTVTYDINEGHYTKVGRLVTATFRIRTDSVSGMTGSVYLGGLPFTAKNVSTGGSNGGLSIHRALQFNTFPDSGYTLDNGDEMLMQKRATANSASVALDAADLKAGTNDNEIMATIIYFTN